MIVQVLEYKGYLVILPEEYSLESCRGWHPVGGERFGSVVSNTKKNLKVSQKALDLMERFPSSGGSLGDLEWFSSTGGGAFGWIGDYYSVKHHQQHASSRDFKIQPEECTIIPNVIPDEHLEMVKLRIKEAEIAPIIES